MLRKSLFSLLLLLMTAACTWWPDFYIPGACPNVVIPRDTAYLTQKINYFDEFQIEVTGFEGFCMPNEKAGRNYGYVTPLFNIQRLKDTDETDVDFSFYIETRQGPPEYLGRKTYSAYVTLGEHEKEKSFKGPTVKVLIPKMIMRTLRCFWELTFPVKNIFTINVLLTSNIVTTLMTIPCIWNVPVYRNRRCLSRKKAVAAVAVYNIFKENSL